MTVTNLTVFARNAAGELEVLPGGPKLDASTKGSVVRVLEEALVIRGTTAVMPDLLDLKHSVVVPLSIRTDGMWLWDDSLLYYLRVHDIAPPNDFVSFYQRRAFEPRKPTESELAEAEAFLA